MIVHELKTIFVHIPKTAGVSFTHALLFEILNYQTEGPIKKLPKELKLRFGLSNSNKHKCARNYIPSITTKKIWNDYYKFAFVRNPWDRVVSEYYWRKQVDGLKCSFEHFIKQCENRIKGKDRGIYWSHAQPQKTYVTNAVGNVIVDDIFKFEEINEGIIMINKKLGTTLQLQKMNTSKHKNYQSYYNDSTKKRIAALYKDDIKMFKYEF